MSHLAARTHLPFPVDVELGGRFAKNILPPTYFITENVIHAPCRVRRRVSQRMPADSTHELFKLVGVARVNRAMTRIMRARRHLVCKHTPILGHEHLNGKQT